MRIQAVLALACMVMSFAIGGCEKSSAQGVTTAESSLTVPLNTPVTITLKNYLLRAPLTVTGTVSQNTTVSGTITALDDQWFVVSTNTMDIWIDRELVGMIEVAR